MTGCRVALLAFLLVTPQQSSKSGEVGQQHQPATKQASKPVTTTTAHQVLPENGQSDTSGKKDSGGADANRWTHADWIQAVTAAATALYFCATVWILVEMKRANTRERRIAARSLWLTRKSNKLTADSLKFTRDSFELAHRPHLIRENFKGMFSGNSALLVELALRNTGTTTANHAAFVWDARQIELTEVFDVQVMAEAPRNDIPMLSVAPNEPVLSRHQFGVGEKSYVDIINGRTKLHVVCTIHYRDDLGVFHMHFIGYEFSPQSGWRPYRDHRQPNITDTGWTDLMLRKNVTTGRPITT
jgi:hypothetical protein